MRSYLLTALGIALLLPGAAAAQSMGIPIGGGPLTISVNPQYPTPYSQATVSVNSSALDLTNATMSVSVGGKKIYGGDVQPVTVTLGAAGSVSTVKITVTLSGGTYNQTLTIQPQDVALVVEPISSAPPLYPGKSLVPLEGSARVVAVANLKGANGKAIDPSKLSYAWTVDGTQIANASGIGKVTAIIDSPLQYRSRTVSVSVASQDGSLAGGASLSLTALEPSARIYVNDPLLGILFDHALSGTYAINGAESTLYAAPFSLPMMSNAPLIQWFLNGDVAQTGNSITLRPTGSGQGGAALSLVASSGDTAKVTTNLSLSFGAKAGSNLFGL